MEAWQETTLGDFVKLQRGHDLTESERQDGQIPVMGSAGQNGFHNRALSKGPGVVIGRSGASFGRVHFAPIDYWPHNTVLYVTDFKGNDPRFVYYCFKSLDFDRFNSGSAQASLNRNYISHIRVLRPPLSEQKAIAAMLGALDDKIELNRRMNETLEAMARALFQSWFVDFDLVRTNFGRKAAGVDEGTAAIFPSRFQNTEIGQIPESWTTSRLGDHVDLVRGNTYKSKFKDLPGPYLFGLGAIHRNGGFRDDSLRTYGGNSAPKLVLRPGDLFASLKDVTQAADLLGAVARVPAEIPAGRLTQDTVKLVPRESGISFAYLYRTLLRPEYRDYCRARATGTTNLGLSREDFLKYPILVPPKAIQNAFDTFDSLLEAKVANNRIETRTLATLRDTLLPKLLSGEISTAITT